MYIHSVHLSNLSIILNEREAISVCVYNTRAHAYLRKMIAWEIGHTQSWIIN